MKRIVRQTKRFRRNYKKLYRSNYRNIAKLDDLIRRIIRKQPLDSHYRDHGLYGTWSGCRDCHVEGNMILIYELDINEQNKDIVIFHAIDNHENLF